LIIPGSNPGMGSKMKQVTGVCKARYRCDALLRQLDTPFTLVLHSVFNLKYCVRDEFFDGSVFGWVDFRWGIETG